MFWIKFWLITFNCAKQISPFPFWFWDLAIKNNFLILHHFNIWECWLVQNSWTSGGNRKELPPGEQNVQEEIQQTLFLGLLWDSTWCLSENLTTEKYLKTVMMAEWIIHHGNCEILHGDISTTVGQPGLQCWSKVWWAWPG